MGIANEGRHSGDLRIGTRGARPHEPSVPVRLPGLFNPLDGGATGTPFARQLVEPVSYTPPKDAGSLFQEGDERISRGRHR
jgi:hypothetical protein